GAMAAAGLVDAHAADQGGIARLHPLHGGGEHFRVLGVDAAVAVDVVHAPVAVVVHEHVRGIPVHVPAQVGPALGVAPAHVVARGAETAHHLHVLHLDPARLQVADGHVELV